MENYALFKLKKELAKIKKRLRNDLIEDLRFMSEVQEDKLKVKQLKRAIEILEKKSMNTNVKNYTDLELLTKVKSLPTYKGLPNAYWILGVRSKEDETDKFDDKCYLFCGSKFVLVTSCTTNKGNKGTGVVCANIWNYGAWQIGKHKGKVKAGIQRVGFAYQRDFTEDGKTNPTSEVKTDIRGFNFHPADHNINRNIIKTNIGGWSEGCFVLNDIPTYLKIINFLEPQKVFSMVIIDEF